MSWMLIPISILYIVLTVEIHSIYLSDIIMDWHKINSSIMSTVRYRLLLHYGATMLQAATGGYPGPYVATG